MARGPNGHRLFAQDLPLRSLDRRDYLGHRAYTEALARALLMADPPLTVALTGEWGVGKTTIAGDELAASLRRHARGAPVGYVYFDVWRYEKDSLRRQVLGEIARQLRSQGLLSGRYDVKRESEDLTIERSEPRLTGLASPKWSIVAIALRTLLIGGLAFVVLNAAGRIQSAELILGSAQNRLGTLGTSFLVALFSSLLLAVPGIINTQERRITHKPVTAADEFVARFQRLMDAAMVKRLVVVVDNLDRCEPAFVVDTLTTLKVFLEPNTAVKPLFVIPCDLSAIRRYMQAVRGSAAEGGDEQTRTAAVDDYLRKFFNVVLRINPFLDVDLQRLVSEELGDIDLGHELSSRPDEKAALVQVITSAFRRNPRRIKQFLNNLVLKRLLLQEHERLGLVQPTISAEIAFMAKVTVIEEEWPDAFARMQADPRGLAHLDAVAAGTLAAPPKDLATLVTPDLRRFLRATTAVTSLQPTMAFARLKLDPDELTLPNYSAFRAALISGDQDELKQHIPSDPDAVDLPRYRSVACRTLREQVAYGYPAALTVIAAISAVDVLHSGSVANELSSELDGAQDVLSELPRIDPTEVVGLVLKANIDAGQRVILKLVRLAWQVELAQKFGEDAWQAWLRQLARTFVGLRAELTQVEVDAVREMSRYVQQRAALVVLTELSVTEDSTDALIDPTALPTVFTTLSAEDLRDIDGLPLYRGAALLWQRCHLRAPDDAVSSFATTAGSLLRTPSPAAGVVERCIGLLCETVGTLARCRHDAASNLAGAVWQNYDALVPGHRWMAGVVIAVLGNDEQNAECGRQWAAEPPDMVAMLQAGLEQFGGSEAYPKRAAASRAFGLLVQAYRSHREKAVDLTESVEAERALQLVLKWAAEATGEERHQLWSNAFTVAAYRGVESRLVARMREELQSFVEDPIDAAEAQRLLMRMTVEPQK